MKRLTKTLAPAAVIAMLGTGVSPAFASETNPVEGTLNVNVYTAEATLPASVSTPDASATITTFADASVAAESIKSIKDHAVVEEVSKKAVSDIENALNNKFEAKLEAAAKVKAEAERVAAEKAAKIQAAAEKAAAKKAEAERVAAEKAATASVVTTQSAYVNSTPVVQTVGAGTWNAPATAAAPVQSSYVAPAAAQTYVAPAAAPAYTAPAQTYVAPQSTNAVAPAVKTPAPVKSASSTNQKIYQAAMAQLGNKQDCTMLVTNALKSVGINFRDWPAGYKKLGTIVPASQAQPGDLIYYKDGGMGLAHIAVYAGNGKAVHGGWGGNDTVINSANVGSGAEYIRVNA